MVSKPPEISSEQKTASDKDKDTHQPGLYKRHFSVFKRAFKLFIENNGAVLAGNLAFLTMMSLFPFIIFLFALSGFLGQTERGLEAVEIMLSSLPSEVASVLSGPVNGLIKNARADLLTVSILFSIWVASNGLEAARGILLKAYGWVEAPALWRRRLESLALVVLSGMAIILAMAIMVVAPAAIRAITSFLPSFANGTITLLLDIVSTFVGPALLVGALSILYFALTPRRVKKPKFLPGALFSMIMLVMTARGFSIYLKYADSYDVTYGSLAGVIITQLFCYLVALGFILGAQINAAYAERAGERIDLRRHREQKNIEKTSNGKSTRLSMIRKNIFRR